MLIIYNYEKIQLESVFFWTFLLSDSTVCKHYCLWRFSAKKCEKRPLLLETNTGLNMQNRPAVGCRLGEKSPIIYLCVNKYIKEGGANVNFLRAV